MASIQERNGKHQVRMRVPGRKTAVFKTFDSYEAAQAFVDQTQKIMAVGAVPSDMLEPGPRADRFNLAEVALQYSALSSTTSSDRELIKSVAQEIEKLSRMSWNYAGVERYVGQLKARRLAPGTIRKRVGLLARILDWHHKRTTGKPQPNAFKMLPVGYSVYAKDVADAPIDVHRDRRLTVDELQALRSALAGVRNPSRQRPLAVDSDFAMLFELILGTGLRLSEAFKLRVDQVDLKRGILKVEGSKGHRGAKKLRNVPLVRSLREPLAVRCEARSGLLFPFWSGKPEDFKSTSARLSMRFRTLFRYAGIEDVIEHDLRHTACCMWVELRRPDGAWVFSDVEIAKIMGWSSLAMMLRYASLRGEDLANRLLDL